jgi:hypothetical protein
MVDQGIATLGGKNLSDKQGKPIRVDVAEASAQPRLGTEKALRRAWCVENVPSNFKGRQDPVYRLYRLAKTREDRGSVIRDCRGSTWIRGSSGE